MYLGGDPAHPPKPKLIHFAGIERAEMHTRVVASRAGTRTKGPNDDNGWDKLEWHGHC